MTSPGTGPALSLSARRRYTHSPRRSPVLAVRFSRHRTPRRLRRARSGRWRFAPRPCNARSRGSGTIRDKAGKAGKRGKKAEQGGNQGEHGTANRARNAPPRARANVAGEHRHTSMISGQVLPAGVTGNRLLLRKSLRRKLAERGGFEPPVQCYPYNGLANRRFRPLSHLS